jgi:hypothetical protein
LPELRRQLDVLDKVIIELQMLNDAQQQLATLEGRPN